LDTGEVEILLLNPARLNWQAILHLKVTQNTGFLNLGNYRWAYLPMMYGAPTSMRH